MLESARRRRKGSVFQYGINKYNYMRYQEFVIKEYNLGGWADVSDDLAQGDELRSDIRRIRSPLFPEFEVRWDEGSGLVWNYYIYDPKQQYKCIANFSVQPQDNLFGSLLAEGVMPMIPHMAVDPGYQGQGIASRCYKAFLNNQWHKEHNYAKWVFATLTQSENAAKLWSALARQPGIVDFFYDRKSQKIIKQPTPTAYRLLGPKNRFNLANQ